MISHYEASVRPLVRSAARLVGDALAVPASDLGRMLDADEAIRRRSRLGHRPERLARLRRPYAEGEALEEVRPLMAPPFVPRRLDERSLEDLRRFFAPLGVELFEHVADRDGHRIRARFLGVETLGYSPASLSRAVLDALAQMPDGVRKKVIR